MAQYQTCNGIDDCGDQSDEMCCKSKTTHTIRNYLTLALCPKFYNVNHCIYQSAEKMLSTVKRECVFIKKHSLMARSTAWMARMNQTNLSQSKVRHNISLLPHSFRKTDVCS